jgi:hypothetical protein
MGEEEGYYHLRNVDRGQGYKILLLLLWVALWCWTDGTGSRKSVTRGYVLGSGGELDLAAAAGGVGGGITATAAVKEAAAASSSKRKRIRL